MYFLICIFVSRISIGDGAPSWYQYFLCGLKGVAEILPKENKLRGMNVVVSGAIPQSAGLSSSSALVSAAALATAHANNVSTSNFLLLLMKLTKLLRNSLSTPLETLLRYRIYCDITDYNSILLLILRMYLHIFENTSIEISHNN